MATISTGSPTNPLLAWKTVMGTCNAPAGANDLVTRWLVLTRACVQPMTLTAAAIAGLLAVRAAGFNGLYFGLAALGVVLAHAANNLINDVFDESLGNDTADYPRALYAPHPVLSGLATRRTMVIAFLVLNVLDLMILIVLTVARGWPVVAFAVLGLVGSVGYAAPILRFKKPGLGEPVVFLVWGPLMVGGTYFAATGHLPWQALAATIPYSLLCTTVLFGKHIDKAPWDSPKGINTLPVILGDDRARKATLAMMIAFYVALLALIPFGALPWTAVFALLALPRLRQAWPHMRSPKPDKAPPNFPVWPLWYAAVTFVHTRRAGALLVLGLLAGAILGYAPPP